jgi:hypothetical protein
VEEFQDVLAGVAVEDSPTPLNRPVNGQPIQKSRLPERVGSVIGRRKGLSWIVAGMWILSVIVVLVIVPRLFELRATQPSSVKSQLTNNTATQPSALSNNVSQQAVPSSPISPRSGSATAEPNPQVLPSGSGTPVSGPGNDTKNASTLAIPQAGQPDVPARSSLNTKRKPQRVPKALPTEPSQQGYSEAQNKSGGSAEKQTPRNHYDNDYHPLTTKKSQEAYREEIQKKSEEVFQRGLDALEKSNPGSTVSIREELRKIKTGKVKDCFQYNNYPALEHQCNMEKMMRMR